MKKGTKKTAALYAIAFCFVIGRGFAAGQEPGLPRHQQVVIDWYNSRLNSAKSLVNGMGSLIPDDKNITAARALAAKITPESILQGRWYGGCQYQLSPDQSFGQLYWGIDNNEVYATADMIFYGDIAVFTHKFYTDKNCEKLHHGRRWVFQLEVKEPLKGEPESIGVDLKSGFADNDYLPGVQEDTDKANASKRWKSYHEKPFVTGEWTTLKIPGGDFVVKTGFLVKDLFLYEGKSTGDLRVRPDTVDFSSGSKLLGKCPKLSDEEAAVFNRARKALGRPAKKYDYPASWSCVVELTRRNGSTGLER